MKTFRRLSEQEQAFLVCVQHRSECPNKEIARLIGCSEQAVRRMRKLFVENGIIYRRAVISLYRIGVAKRALFFSLGRVTDQQRSKLLEFLLDDPRVAYVAEVGGDYRYKIDVCSRNQGELYSFLSYFSEQFGELLREKALVQLVSQTELTVKFLCSRRFDVEPLSQGIGASCEGIDPLDHKILHHLSEIGEKTFGQVARELGLPSTTLDYRVRSLRERGILVGFRYVVDTSRLGLQDFFHLIYLKGMSHAVRDRISNFCARHPHVRYFVETMGSWDIEIGSNVAVPAQAMQLTEELYNIAGEAVIRISTLPLFCYHRVSNYPL